MPRHLGGQFLLAHQIPGKEEFAETLRYYQHELDRHGVRIHLGTRFEPTDVGAAQDKGDPFKAVAWCAGIRPRVPSIPGNDLPIAVPYDKVLRGEVEVGQRVALIGAGGIGFDVADFLSHPHGEETVDGFRKSWGIAGTLEHDGGLIEPQRPDNGRTLYLLQRKEGNSTVTSNLETVTNVMTDAFVEPTTVEPSVTFFTTFMEDIPQAPSYQTYHLTKLTTNHFRLTKGNETID